MKYTILTADELENVDFSEVKETNAQTLRYNNEKTKFLLKFDGDTPSFLAGKELFDYDSIMQILNSPEWTQED